MANPDYFETMQTLAAVETLRQAGLSVETDDLEHTHQQYYREAE